MAAGTLSGLTGQLQGQLARRGSGAELSRVADGCKACPGIYMPKLSCDSENMEVWASSHQERQKFVIEEILHRLLLPWLVGGSGRWLASLSHAQPDVVCVCQPFGVPASWHASLSVCKRGRTWGMFLQQHHSCILQRSLFVRAKQNKTSNKQQSFMLINKWGRVGLRTSYHM